LKPIADSVGDSIEKLAKPKSKRPSDDEIRSMDEFASAIISLQDNCQWGLLETYLGVINNLTKTQV
jgi:hypothetical protein